MAKRGAGEGTIYQRSDGRWEAKIDVGWQGGRRRRKSIYGQTRRAVHQKLVAALKAQGEARLVVGKMPTVGQFLQQWLEVARPGLRPKTYTSYEGTVRLHIRPSLGALPIDKLSPVHIHRVIVELSTKQSARTVQYMLHVLRIALNRAVRWGLVARNVAALVDALRVPQRQVRVLTREQAQQLIEAVRENRLGALYTVALSLGLRQGEALGLRWTDIDLDGRTLTVGAALQRVPGRGLVLVEPKTETSRRKIPLPPLCVAALRQQRVRQLQERLLAGSLWVETGLVFITAVGTGLESGSVTKHLQRILSRHDLPRLRFHDLRHSAASLLLAQGIPSRVVMEVLGHSRIGVTMDLYSHVLPSLLGDAADAMERALGRQDGRQTAEPDADEM